MVKSTSPMTFTSDDKLAVGKNNHILYLDRGHRKDVAAVVYVQHKTFSVMCAVEGTTTRLTPIACPIDNSPNFLMEEIINTKKNYTMATAVHQSDRDGSYRLHTQISNQIVNADKW